MQALHQPAREALMTDSRKPAPPPEASSRATFKLPASRSISLTDEESPDALPGGYVLQSPGAMAVRDRQKAGTPPSQSGMTPESQSEAPSLPPPVVHTPPPTDTLFQADTDPNYVSVSLPSQFYFYPFKQISIRGIKVVHQAKFARAARNRSTRLTCEAMTSLLGDNINAMNLSIPDLKYLMYYLRMNDFNHVPMQVTGVCDNSKHLDRVESNQVAADSLLNSQIVKSSELIETPLDTAALDLFFAEESNLAFLHSQGYTITAPRYFDTCELEEMLEAMTDASVDDIKDLTYLADLAGCLRTSDGQRTTLRSRMDFVQELSPPEVAPIKAFSALLGNYGIRELFTLTCKECGAKILTEVTIAAPDFL